MASVNRAGRSSEAKQELSPSCSPRTNSASGLRRARAVSHAAISLSLAAIRASPSRAKTRSQATRWPSRAGTSPPSHSSQPLQLFASQQSTQQAERVPYQRSLRPAQPARKRKGLMPQQLVPIRIRHRTSSRDDCAQRNGYTGRNDCAQRTEHNGCEADSDRCEPAAVRSGWAASVRVVSRAAVSFRPCFRRPQRRRQWINQGQR